MYDVIDRHFEEENVRNLMEEHGISVQALWNWCKRAAVLDKTKDEPLPQWALDILSLGKISYRARKNMLIGHNRDIFRYRKGLKDDTRPKIRVNKSPMDYDAVEAEVRAKLGIANPRKATES